MGRAERTPRIVVAPVERAPSFPLDAVVAEEDTYLVLGTDPVPRETYEPLERLAGHASAGEPAPPGSVLVRAGSPLTFLAVIHDLEAEPTWRDEWVASALSSVLREAEARDLRSIALPMLGTLHGTMAQSRFLQLFRSALGSTASAALENIWLVVPQGTDSGLFEELGDFDIEVRS